MVTPDLQSRISSNDAYVCLLQKKKKNNTDAVLSVTISVSIAIGANSPSWPVLAPVTMTPSLRKYSAAFAVSLIETSTVIAWLKT